MEGKALQLISSHAWRAVSFRTQKCERPSWDVHKLATKSGCRRVTRGRLGELHKDRHGLQHMLEDFAQEPFLLALFGDIRFWQHANVSLLSRVLGQQDALRFKGTAKGPSHAEEDSLEGRLGIEFEAEGQDLRAPGRHGFQEAEERNWTACTSAEGWRTSVGMSKS